MVAQRVNEFLKGKMLRTNYLDNNGLNKDIKGSDCQIGLKSSREQHAYEGFLGITVEVKFPALEKKNILHRSTFIVAGEFGCNIRGCAALLNIQKVITSAIFHLNYL
jgi:hypothetical protein